jgi:hypothetical protein
MCRQNSKHELLVGEACSTHGLTGLAYKFLDGISERSRPLGRCRNILEDNIKITLTEGT